ncbi:unnamed protein product, partial [Laminaria digitata]
ARRLFDSNATQVLPVELREEFYAFYVEGDGNCLWRSIFHGLWGTDYFWSHVKLVTLAKAAANAEQLVGENRHLHNSCLYYSDAVLAKYQVNENCKQDDYEMMLLSQILRMCTDREWGCG